MYQGQIDNIITEKTYAASTYVDKQILEFCINLTKNHYTNFTIMLLCLPITIRKKSNVAEALDGDMIIVNNFFAHWIREINIISMQMILQFYL